MQFDDILSLDLEISKDGKRLWHLGAVLGDNIIDLRNKNAYKEGIAKLNQLAASAHFVLGHNLGEHDLPWLYQQKVSCQHLQALPIIDTLFLSPLAFPKNPYHRLVKDYKLVKDSYNDPVADAKLALSIFTDQWHAFMEQYQKQPDLIELYAYLFTSQSQIDFATEGMAQVMHKIIRQPSGKSPDQLITHVIGNKACTKQMQALIKDFHAGNVTALSLAYAAAWLQVAEGNSVLPPWVWRRFPEVKKVIRQLRETNCQQQECTFCHNNFDAKAHLNRFFELPDFRTLPDGTPLQREIVDAAINGQPLLGILPTGGGKSLCFQLPAIVRNRRNASLTIVISPLQALMKDQVDNLKSKVGYEGAAAIYGMLTMPERSATLEAVKMGNINILYLSPEQLRNRSVKNSIQARQIGAWVFDEAHCLSKWGHDFRPDYLHCATVIKDIALQQKEAPAPIYCYTATAKLDVVDDIINHFKHNLSIELAHFAGGVARDNLSYQVVETPMHNKLAQILDLLDEFFTTDKSGSCVIYATSRRQVEELAAALAHRQALPVCFFHAGIEAGQKRDILEDFIAGKYRIVCATNAFGMGIDKDNVRLVIHHDIPGSLENYLQEAGRAGRDRQPAHCILLFDNQDIEQQFQMTKQSEVRLKDIGWLLKEIRSRAKFSKDGRIVVTPRELLRAQEDNLHLDSSEDSAITKVKTAIAWLEREGFLQRGDNINSVFQGKPLFSNLQEAKAKLANLNLSPTAERQWEIVLQALMSCDPNAGLNADDILDAVIAQVKDAKQRAALKPERIMDILAQMAAHQLVDCGLSMTAYLCPKGKRSCRNLFQEVNQIEHTLLQILPELAPYEGDNKQQYPLDIRALNSELIKAHKLNSSTRLIRNILKSWSEDGKIGGAQGSISFTVTSKEFFSLQLHYSWQQITKRAQARQLLTSKVIDFLYDTLPKELCSLQKKVLLEFTLEQGINNVHQDLEIRALLAGKNTTQQTEYLLKGVQRALLFLDQHKAIELQNGMAVFKQAMEITLNPDKQQHYYRKSHYQQLYDHYFQKVVQVHVMNEYARLGMEHIKLSLKLVQDYFDKRNDAFINIYFKQRKQILERATSQASWERIVTDLNNKNQEQIVHGAMNKNQLILAGPGSGKTKVIIHRIAYLIRVKQVPAHKILVVSFNHNATSSLHKRLFELLGKTAYGVSVHTFHGLALRLIGRTVDPDELTEKGFDQLITEATALLQGDIPSLGVDTDHQRADLLGGIEHILVDEYQDIDAPQYQMVAALVGKNLAENDNDEKLNLLAVGDDDQSIYGFRDANIEFIQRFKQDYNAEIHYLTENYRCSAQIINAANSLIQHNQDRMKHKHKITVNKAREAGLLQDFWRSKDPKNQGKVKQIRCFNQDQQALEVVQQIQQIIALDTQCQYSDIAVLARHGIEKPILKSVRSALHQAGIPYRYQITKESGFALHKVREIVQFKQFLQTAKQQMLSCVELQKTLPKEKNLWHELLAQLIDDWQTQFGSEPIITSLFLRQLNDFLIEQKRQTRYGQGVLLSTAHGVKGEEFKQVLILDGNWQAKLEEKEEERRLYYVAMTRAIDQLLLFNLADEHNTHLSCIAEKHCSYLVSNAANKLTQHIEFATIGMSQMYLSYAGRFAASEPIHQRLAEIGVGAAVSFRFTSSQQKIQVIQQQQVIGELSESGKKRIAPLMQRPYQAQIIAMLERTSNPENEFDQKNQVDTWWVPIIQVQNE